MASPEKATEDDIDLVELSGLFATPAAICVDLLFYPGTHTQGSSLSDQYLACSSAVEAGQVQVGVLAAVSGVVAGTSVLWFLYVQATRSHDPTPPAEPPDPPADPVVPPPVTWPPELQSDAGRLLTQNPELGARDHWSEAERLAAARTILKQCRVSAAAANLDPDKCLELPLFVSGDLSHPTVTDHDYQAIGRHPTRWVQLNYTTGKNASWKDADPRCEGQSVLAPCHEYPYLSTEQGGPVLPVPSLKLVPRGQNASQGAHIGRFYGDCLDRVRGRPFINVAMPRGSNMTTQRLCNGVG